MEMKQMFGILTQMDENRRLDKLREELQTADLRGKKECVKCGFCCHKRTCIPTPDELREIAKFLKLTPKELINKYFAIDTDDVMSSFWVKPVGVNIIDLAGKYIPPSRTFNEGKCVFLDENNLCKIHEVKPKSAKISKCWIKKEPDYDVFKLWKRDTIKEEFGIEFEVTE